MKQKEAKPLVIAAWKEWMSTRELDAAEATGRDALRFYYDMKDAKSPLLKFRTRARDKWEVIHDWLMRERRI
jgi:hypothetical protein